MFICDISVVVTEYIDIKSFGYIEVSIVFSFSMAEIKGNLYKRRGGKFGSHMKNAWQSRPFEIKEGVLYYYEDSRKSKPRGKLTLSETSLILNTTYEDTAPYKFSFELVPAKGEKWRLCAASRQEMDMWCDSLDKYVSGVTNLSSTSRESSKNNEMKGFLLKRRGGIMGSKMKNAWQGRYFEIKGRKISYYEDEGENVKPRGEMNLKSGETSLVMYTSYEHAAPNAYTFELIPTAAAGQDEKWRLCASSSEEMQSWCSCIKACLSGEDDLNEEDYVCRKHSSSSLGRSDSIHSAQSQEDIFDTDVYGGDDVVMSLAWQKRSARTMSGVDRVACEAAARAALEQEKELQRQGVDRKEDNSSTMSFDGLLELVDDETEESVRQSENVDLKEGTANHETGKASYQKNGKDMHIEDEDINGGREELSHSTNSLGECIAPVSSQVIMT